MRAAAAARSLDRLFTTAVRIVESNASAAEQASAHTAIVSCLAWATSGRQSVNELTERLSIEQPVVVGGPEPSVEELRKRIDEIGHVFIKFTETRGGTDLGIRLDRDASDLSAADFDQGKGTVHVEGTLILNDDPVRCIADIDLSTLTGTGHLRVVEESEVLPAD
jgi:hypothetical protein